MQTAAKRLKYVFALLGGFFLLKFGAACSPPKPPEGGVTTSPVRMAEETPVKPQTTADYTLGNGVCDQFLRDYESCINERAPQAHKSEMRAAFEKTVEDLHKWRTERPESLQGYCQQASGLTLKAMQPYGCAW